MAHPQDGRRLVQASDELTTRFESAADTLFSTPALEAMAEVAADAIRSLEQFEKFEAFREARDAHNALRQEEARPSPHYRSSWCPK